jgi:hypothetical protein
MAFEMLRLFEATVTDVALSDNHGGLAGARDRVIKGFQLASWRHIVARATREGLAQQAVGAGKRRWMENDENGRGRIGESGGGVGVRGNARLASIPSGLGKIPGIELRGWRFGVPYRVSPGRKL